MSLNAYCNQPDVQTISLPLFPTNKKSREFRYSYRYRSGTGRPGPVIIFIPGGPGEDSIQPSQYADQIYNIPNNYDAIFTDPRGLGCNKDLNGDIFPEIFSSSLLASDILAMIKHLQLKNYILFGHSYGTVLATEVGARAEKGEAPPPSAIVLHGIVGHALIRETPYTGFVKQWNRIKANLPRSILSRLSSNNLPFGLSNDAWGRFIVGQLAQGAGPNFPDDLKSLLSLLESEDIAQLERLRRAVIRAGEYVEDPRVLAVFRPIWCNELSSQGNSDMALINGQLVGGRDPNLCDGFSLMSPYDSKKYVLSVPLYYISGANDPATTFEQAMYHFSHQSAAVRNFIDVSGAGHIPFMNLSDCQGEIWESIVNGTDLSLALSACRWPTRLTIKGIGQ